MTLLILSQLVTHKLSSAMSQRPLTTMVKAMRLGEWGLGGATVDFILFILFLGKVGEEKEKEFLKPNFSFASISRFDSLSDFSELSQFSFPSF